MPLELTSPTGEAEQPHQSYPVLSQEGELCLNPAFDKGNVSNKLMGLFPSDFSVSVATLRVLHSLLYTA